MAHNIGFGFNPSTNEPIDARYILETGNPWDNGAISHYNVFEGSLVYAVANNKLYIYTNSSVTETDVETEGNWLELTAHGGNNITLDGNPDYITINSGTGVITRHPIDLENDVEGGSLALSDSGGDPELTATRVRSGNTESSDGDEFPINFRAKRQRADIISTFGQSRLYVHNSDSADAEAIAGGFDVTVAYNSKTVGSGANAAFVIEGNDADAEGDGVRVFFPLLDSLPANASADDKALTINNNGEIIVADIVDGLSGSVDETITGLWTFDENLRTEKNFFSIDQDSAVINAAIGQIGFNGQNSAGDDHGYTRIISYTHGITDGSERGRLDLDVRNSDDWDTGIRFSSDGTNVDVLFPSLSGLPDSGKRILEIDSNGEIAAVDAGNAHNVVDLSTNQNVGGVKTFTSGDLVLRGADTDISFTSTETAGDANILHSFQFYGQNDNSENFRYGGMYFRSADVSDGAEKGQIEWQLANAGSTEYAMRLIHKGNNIDLVLPELGSTTSGNDFLVIDSDGVVQKRNYTPGSWDGGEVGNDITIKNSTPELRIENSHYTNSNNNAGREMELNFAALNRFNVGDGNSAVINWATITGRSQSADENAEYGRMTLSVFENDGDSGHRTGIQIDGKADSALTTIFHELDIDATIVDDVKLSYDDPLIVTEHTGSISNGDTIGRWEFDAEDSGGTSRKFAVIEGQAVDATNVNWSGGMRFRMQDITDGWRTGLQMHNSTTENVVEYTLGHFKSNGDADIVGISSTGELSKITESAGFTKTTAGAFTIEQSSDGGNSSDDIPQLTLYRHYDASDDPTNGDTVGEIYFNADHGNNASHAFARIQALAPHTVVDSERGRLGLAVRSGDNWFTGIDIRANLNNGENVTELRFPHLEGDGAYLSVASDGKITRSSSSVNWNGGTVDGNIRIERSNPTFEMNDDEITESGGTFPKELTEIKSFANGREYSRIDTQIKAYDSNSDYDGEVHIRTASAGSLGTVAVFSSDLMEFKAATEISGDIDIIKTDLNNAPALVFNMNNTSISDDQQIGLLEFNAYSNGDSGSHGYARIRTFAEDSTNNSEKGKIDWQVRDGNTWRNGFSLTQSASGSGNTEFEIQAEKVALAGITGGTNNFVAIDADGNLSASTVTATFDGGTVANSTTFQSNVTYEQTGPISNQFSRTSGITADNTAIGEIEFRGTINNINQAYGAIEGGVKDQSEESGFINLSVARDNAHEVAIEVYHDSTGTDTTTNILSETVQLSGLSNLAADKVLGIDANGNLSVQDGAEFEGGNVPNATTFASNVTVTGNTTMNGDVTLGNAFDDEINVNGIFTVKANQNFGTPVALRHDGDLNDGEDIAYFNFNADDDSNTATEYARITGIARDTSSGSTKGQIDFDVTRAGTLGTAMEIEDDGTDLIVSVKEKFVVEGWQEEEIYIAGSGDNTSEQTVHNMKIAEADVADTGISYEYFDSSDSSLPGYKADALKLKAFNITVGSNDHKLVTQYFYNNNGKLIYQHYWLTTRTANASKVVVATSSASKIPAKSVDGASLLPSQVDEAVAGSYLGYDTDTNSAMFAVKKLDYNNNGKLTTKTINTPDWSN